MTIAQGINSKSGSLLVEVLVSTLIIAMMMSTLFGFVSFAGEVWRKTHSTVNLTNEGNMVMDTIERELSVALSIVSPTPGNAATSILYTKRISDYQGTPVFGKDGVFRITADYVNRLIRLSIVSAPTTDGGWTMLAGDSTRNANINYYNYNISNHVSTAVFERKSVQLMEISVTLAVKSEDEKIDKKIVLTRNVVMPSL